MQSNEGTIQYAAVRMVRAFKWPPYHKSVLLRSVAAYEFNIPGKHWLSEVPARG